jgi:hypothetical protein
MLSSYNQKIIMDKKINFQTYWPILHSLIVESQILPAISKNLTADSKKLNFLMKDSMGLAYGLHLSNLKSYGGLNLDFFQKYLTHFRKNDLDAMQCVLVVLWFLSFILEFFLRRDRLGVIAFGEIDLAKFIREIISKKLNLFEIFLVQYDLDSYLSKMAKGIKTNY